MQKGRLIGRALGTTLVFAMIWATLGALPNLSSGITNAGIAYASSSYDLQAAVSYAETWWSGRNPAYYDYGSYDCANFVSQCLIAGGLNLEVYSNIDGYGCIPNCDNLDDYLVNYLGAQHETKARGQLEPLWFLPGDVAIFGDSSDQWRHAVFAVTGDATHCATCNAHSQDVHHVTIQQFFDANPSFTICSYYHVSGEISQPPDPPTLVSPGSGSYPGLIITTLTPWFNWNSVPDADYYGLYVRDLDTDVIVFDSQLDYGPIYGTSFPLPSGILSYGTHYRWNMNSHSGEVWGDYSDRLWFTTYVMPPIVEFLHVSPGFVALGDEFTITYVVSDSGGLGLKQTELWRANDVGGIPDWDGTENPVQMTALPGYGSYTGGFYDAPPAVGTYWYGLHVVDNTGEWNDERNSRTGGSPGVFGPIRVEVIQASNPPQVTTEGASSITTSSAVLTGYLDSTGGETCQVWFEYGLSTSYGSSTSKLSVSSTGPFSAFISTLDPDTTYHFKACAQNSKGSSYGLDTTFQTEYINQIVTFPDPNLEAAIRVAIGKPTGDIYQSDLNSLTTLDANSRNIVDLSELEHCTALTQLWLHYNQISDISPLSNLDNLTYLSLIGNEISDITPLSSLPSLTHLWLVSNQIGDITPLHNLISLTCLWLADNQIGDITPLSNLTNLASLHIFANQISELSPLSNLTSLTELELGNNRISDISPLFNLTSLTGLGLYGNHINDITPLSNLTSLTELWLQYNQISDITPVSNLISLTKLGLHYNQISVIIALVQNTGLGVGDTIDLRANPLSADSLDTYIPQLEQRGVNVLYDAPRTWCVDDDLVDYPAADFTNIQDAVDAASPGDTIIVYPGTYIENVDVNKGHLTIQSESGAETTIVQAANPNDHVFEVTSNYIAIIGFTVKGVTAYSKAGLYLQNADHCNISENMASNNAFGIYSYSSCDNDLSNNNASNNNIGIGLYYSSSNNALINNTVNSNNAMGIYLYSSGNNNLINNTMSGNSRNFGIDGVELPDYIQNIDTSNEVDGSPIYYWISYQDQQIPSDAGYVGIIDCTNIVVEGLVLRNNHQGVLLAYSSNSRIENIEVLNNDWGIRLDSSDNNTLTKITASNNGYDLRLDSSSNNLIYLNNFYWRACSYNSDNTWNSPEEVTYTYNGNTHTSYLGNYWGWDYTGTDANGDGVGDTPHSMVVCDGVIDNYPLVELFENYGIGPTQVYPAGMVSYWKLDESSGISAVDCVGDNHGILTNGPVWTVGKVQNALNLDGVNDYVEITDSDDLDFQGPFTIETWIKPNERTYPSMYIVAKRDYSTGLGTADANYELYIGTSSDPRYLIFNVGNVTHYTTLRALTPVTFGSWNHVAAVYDGSSLTIFVNGNAIASGKGIWDRWGTLVDPDRTITPKGNTDSLTIGALKNRNPMEGFYGTIDEVAIYNRALIQEEIQQHYQNGLNGFGYEKVDTTPPNCVIELHEQGTISQVDTVDEAEFFDIYVGSSTDDTGIVEVRFSSDDFQDGVPTGEWTAWCNWDISLGDWNAVSKTKAWSFATVGYKEVWAEIKDDSGNTGRCYANIWTRPPYGPFPYGYRFANGAATQNVDLLPWIEVVEGLTQDDKRTIFDETFDWSNLVDPAMKELLFQAFEDEIGKGGNCYGMATSSLMEYAYPDYDGVLEAQDADYLWDLSVPWALPLGIWDGRNMQEKPILKHILKFQLSQYGISSQEERMDFNLDPLAMAKKLQEAGKDYIVGIGYWEIVNNSVTPKAHALVPYGIEEYNDKVRVYVYDPNYPDEDGDMMQNDSDRAYDNYVEIDKGLNTWRYLWRKPFAPDEYWPPVDAIVSFLTLIPIEAHHYYTYDGVAKPGGILTGYPGPGYCLVDGNINLMLTDSEGRTTGVQDGSFVEEIPGVKPICDFFSASETWRQQYYISDDTALRATIGGIGEGIYSVTRFGSGYFAEVSDISTSEGAVDTVILSADTAELFFSDDQESRTYDLLLHLATDDGNQTFNASDILAVPGANHKYTIDWDALSQGQEGVTVQVDSDGDGIFEQTVTSNGELTHDEFVLQTQTAVDFDPDVLNLRSTDKYVTAYIELPTGFDVRQIDISSIRLNGTVPALAKPTKVGDHDKDRVPDLMVKFDASAVKSLLTAGSQVEITITGEVAGIGFQGSDTIRVIGGDNMAKFPGWLRWFLLWLFGWR